MEDGVISGITSNKNLLKISIKSVSLNFLQIANMITQNNNHIEFMQEIKSNEEYSFITNLTDKNNLQTLLTNLKDDKQLQDFTFDTEIATISLIGYGIKNDYKLALMSFDDAYNYYYKYCNKNSYKFIVSKNYFEKYLYFKLSDYIVYEKFIETNYFLLI
jgi:aspartokinase